MPCPNCGETMKPVFRDNQSILHCSNCGASFFEDNGINRITPESAEALSNDRFQTHLPNIAALKKCPRDAAVMKPVINSEAIPRNVTLYHCNTCNGVFAGADDLLHFKKAQHVKVDYFRIWEMPLPGLQSVLIIFIFALLTGSIYLGVNSIQRNASYRSEASEVINTVVLSKSGRYMFISFKTKTPFKSEVIFKNQTKGETVIKQVSKELSLVHYAAFTQFASGDKVFFRVKLTDGSGNSIETAEKKLTF